ncbi:transglycosylase SLT domain-containing protein [Streptomyces sp. NPDC017260]|uniref:aggregation-promoting factor C-terminal-like domain-containing protein n=1 Tax=unclassified Streptomyces TaxID=2593676 RepID=UPI0037A78DC0
MSRPKLPHYSWRQMRIASAAALTVLLTTASLAQPADAEPPEPAPAHTALPALDQALTASHHTAGHTLKAQSAAQSAAHREAAAKARKAQQEREARQRAARAAARAKAQAREAEQQRTDRSASRPQATTATVSGARTYARSRLSTAQYECLSAVLTRESGWNHRAVNPSSGAYGLFQALPPSKMSSAGSDWRTNPLTQMRWGLSYMESRYGSPCGAWNFWQKNHWY